jgi:DNA-binding CsgD family transcriptional regulator/PAS domain-containing protein
MGDDVRGDDVRRLSSLVGDIYDAAIEPGAWPAALAGTAKFVGGPAAALFSKNATSRTGSVAYDAGVDPYYRRIYFEQYIKLDPATTGHFFADVEEPVATADLIPYDEFLQTRFYREWARPQHLVDFISATLDKSTTSAAMFGVFRHERDGVVTDETRARMRLVVPHVRRAVLIGRLMDMRSTEAAALADTLDGIAAGMFLVDALGRIVHANAAGHVMIGTGDFLRAPGGRLTAADPDADAALHAVLAATPKTGVGENGVSLALTDHAGSRHVAHVLPLTPGIRRNVGAGYAAVAAIFVHAAALHRPHPPEVIAKAYRLTPTELRVLLAIVEIGGVPEVAEALGVAESTVKTHLGRLYEKTGTDRQADLVKLVAKFANPLVR